MSTLSVDTIQGQTTAANVKLPAGTPVQVVSQSTTTQTNISSTSFTATGLSQTITPKYASSKILILVNMSADFFQQGNSSKSLGLQILRDSTAITTRGDNCYAGVATNGYYSVPIHGTISFLDSPSTTNSITYSVKGNVSSTSNSTTLRMGNSNATSTLTLMEIAQ